MSDGPCTIRGCKQQQQGHRCLYPVTCKSNQRPLSHKGLTSHMSEFHSTKVEVTLTSGSVTLQRIDDNPEKPFTCCVPGCAQTFSSRKTTVNHVKGKHANFDPAAPPAAPDPPSCHIPPPPGARAVDQSEDGPSRPSFIPAPVEAEGQNRNEPTVRPAQAPRKAAVDHLKGKRSKLADFDPSAPPAAPNPPSRRIFLPPGARVVDQIEDGPSRPSTSGSSAPVEAEGRPPIPAQNGNEPTIRPAPAPVAPPGPPAPSTHLDEEAYDNNDWIISFVSRSQPVEDAPLVTEPTKATNPAPGPPVPAPSKQAIRPSDPTGITTSTGTVTNVNLAIRSELDHMDRTMTCPICQDIFVGAHVVHPCGHTFCGYCLWAWWHMLGSKGQCPTCRTVVPSGLFYCKNFAVDDIAEQYIGTLKRSGHPSWQEGGSSFRERVLKQAKWEKRWALIQGDDPFDKDYDPTQTEDGDDED